MKADVAGRLREFASRTDLHESASSATNGGTEVLDGNVMERIQGLMGEILGKSSAREGTCLYRGEPECYAIVSSGLYRAWSDSENEAFKIGRMEQEIVERARQYTTLADDEEILAEIQHFGGATNLLDFTDDYLIALFFASVKNEGADGRVVLHWPDLKTVIRPKHTNNRVVFQKSVFVRPRRGFIVPDAREGTVVVSGDLKVSILTFLERFHGISERSVYNDMHGYIRNQNLGRSQYAAEFRETLTGSHCHKRLELGDYLAARPGEIARVNMRNYCHQKGMEYTDQAGSEFAIVTLDAAGPKTEHRLLLQPDQVVDLVSHCIENNDDRVRMAEAYCWRADALLFLGSTERAADDFERALVLDEGLAGAYHGRANVRRRQGDVDGARADLEEALRLDPRLPAALLDRGNMHREEGSVKDAIRDYEAAMQGSTRGSNYAWFRDGHFYRAVARCIQKEWRGAEADLELAREQGLRVALSFRNIFGGVERFEGDHGLKLPSLITTQLYVGEDVRGSPATCSMIEE